MEEVMNFEFFKARLDPDGSLKDLIKAEFNNVSDRFDHVDESMAHIVDVTEETLRNTHQIIKLNEEMINKIAQSTSTILQGVFEATEVTTPTCFIILPYKLEKKVVDDGKGGNKSKLQVAHDSLKTANDFLQKVDSWSGTISEAMENPTESVKTLVSEKMESLFR